MRHRKLHNRAFEAAAFVARRKKAAEHPLNDGIQKVKDDISGLFVRFCKKHNSNMKAVWAELHSYLRQEGKTKTIRALREAADMMSTMTVKEALKVMEGMGLDTRNGIDLMVIVKINGESFSIRMPNLHSGKDTTLKNKDYAVKVICAAIGIKGNEAFDYLQRQIGNKATKGLFRKAAEEMAA